MNAASLSKTRPPSQNRARVLYDEDLVEAAVFALASRKENDISPLQKSRYFLEKERLYGIADPEERDRAFFRLHSRWFREWETGERVTRCLADFPWVMSGLETLSFRTARSRQESGAELYRHASGTRNGVIALFPEDLLRPEGRFLRHELTHLSDMVDPAFGYSTDLAASGVEIIHLQVVRERYRVLWDVTIEGRLVAGDQERRRRCREEFDRAFRFWTGERREEVFTALWREAAPAHLRLLQLASDGRGTAEEDGPPEPGALCPLCSLPSFEWADRSHVTENVRRAVQRDFPNWNGRGVLCARCLEVYETPPLELPATLYIP